MATPSYRPFWKLAVNRNTVIVIVAVDLTMTITDLTITNTGYTIRRPCNGLGGRAGALRHAKAPPHNLGDLLTS